jgi:hypothetical protein
MMPCIAGSTKAVDAPFTTDNRAGEQKRGHRADRDDVDDIAGLDDQSAGEAVGYHPAEQQEDDVADRESGEHERQRAGVVVDLEHGECQCDRRHRPGDQGDRSREEEPAEPFVVHGGEGADHDGASLLCIRQSCHAPRGGRRRQ